MGSRELSKSDYELIKEYFAQFDEDKTGNITRADLRKGLQAIGRNPTMSDVTDLMSELGVKGAIGYREFEKCMRVMIEEGDITNEEDLLQAFKVFDKNGDGYVDKDELSTVLKKCGEKLTEEDVDELFRDADINGDGQISYKEFVEMML